MGLFDFRSAAQRKEDEELYAEKIFPRGMQVQQEISALIGELCSSKDARWVMLAYVCGKEGVLKLRDKASRAKAEAPSRDEEREAALKRINPKRSKLGPYETRCALALVFADLAADEGEPMATLAELKSAIAAAE